MSTKLRGLLKSETVFFEKSISPQNCPQICTYFALSVWSCEDQFQIFSHVSVHTLAAGKIVLLPVLVKPSSMNPIQIVTKNPTLLKLNSSMLKLLLLPFPKLEPFLSFLDSSHVDYYLFAHFPVLITERNHGNFDAFLVSEDGRASFH